MLSVLRNVFGMMHIVALCLLQKLTCFPSKKYKCSFRDEIKIFTQSLFKRKLYPFIQMDKYFHFYRFAKIYTQCFATSLNF
jgi:hypothetical protein